MKDIYRKTFGISIFDQVFGGIALIGSFMLLVVFYSSYSDSGNLGSSEEMHFFVKMDQSYGVASGADIRLKGVVVGKIIDVELQSGEEASEPIWVQVSISILPEFLRWITQGSWLEIDSTVGLASVIGGSGLVLFSKAGGRQLQTDEWIEFVTPMAPQQLVDQYFPPRLRKKAAEVIEHTYQISKVLNDHREDMGELLSSGAIAAEHASEAAKDLPLLSNKLLLLSDKLDSRAAEFREVLQKTVETMEQIDGLTNQTHSIIEKKSQPLDTLIRQSKLLVEEARSTVKAVKGHWLLNNKNDRSIQNEGINWNMGGDRALYDE